MLGSSPETHQPLRKLAAIGAAVGFFATAQFACTQLGDEPRLNILEAPLPEVEQPFDEKITIATWNIHLGKRFNGQSNTRPDPENIESLSVPEVIRRLDADIFCMQEVTVGAAHAIIEELGNYNGVFDLRDQEKSVRNIFDGFSEEIGTLTMFSSRFADINSLEAMRKKLYDRDDSGTPRSVQLTQVDHMISVLNTHLSSHDGFENLKQAEEIVAYGKANTHTDGVLVMCGDFNTTNSTPAGDILLSDAADYTDCDTTFSNKTIDFITVSNGALIEECNVLPSSTLSDHRLTLARVAITA